MGKTLFDKVWDAHVVRELDGGRSVLYIDRHYIHEVTSPVAFLGLKNRGLKVARPAQTTGTPDHNVPTVDQHLPVAEEQSRNQLDSFRRNCEENGIEYFPLGNPGHGIVHIIGPEQGFTQPGMTIVCGDSHTSTHGAFGAVAFGIGTSEVEMVFASQCILQPKPKTMRITVNGKRKAGVTAKDIILYVISKISASGGTGHFIEFAGEAIIDTISPFLITNLPSGIATSSPRSTPPIRTSQRNWLSISMTESPSSLNSGFTLNFRSSTFPLANGSILIADGKRRILEISVAAAYSGLIIMEIPSCCLIKVSSLL